MIALRLDPRACCETAVFPRKVLLLVGCQESSVVSFPLNWVAVTVGSYNDAPEPQSFCSEKPPALLHVIPSVTLKSGHLQKP